MMKNLTRFLLVSFMLRSNITFATNYYVSALTGNDSNNGLTEATAFATLTKFTSGVNYGPGDVIYIMNGTYTSSAHDVLKITKQGTAAQPITFKNYPGHTPMIDFDTWNAILITDGAAYIIIDGIKIRGNNRNIDLASAVNQPSSCDNPTGSPNPIYNGNGINIDGGGTAPCHHITVRNCEIFECGGGGVGAGKCDYITIENNHIYKTSWYTIYGTSGISILGGYDIDNEVNNFKVIIRNNILHENRLFVKWKTPCKITDGNGIIYDTNNNAGSTPARPAYNGKALIENNICYLNGGRGIECFKSGNLVIRNNTTYQNALSPEITEGDIDVNTATNVQIYNNIVYSRPGGKTISVANASNITSDNNLLFNSYTTSTYNNNDRIGIDPQLNNPAAGDFTLKPNSPAINKGSQVPGQFSANDILNVARPFGSAPDIGAYEYTGIVVPPANQLKPGNLVALRIGDGTTALSANATSVTLLEYTPTGTESGVVLPLNTAASPNRLVIGGAATNVFDGQLSLSGDGRYLSAIGYDLPVGDPVANFNTAPRTIIRIGSDGNVDYSTKSTISTVKVTSAVSDNGLRFWSTGVGAGNATRISTFGATNGSYALYDQFRSLGIFNGRLYTSNNNNVGYTGVDPAQPLSNNKINYIFPGFPVTGHSYQSFVLLDQDAAVGYNYSYLSSTATPPAVTNINTDYDVLYCADVSLGLVKFYYNGTTWVFAGSYNPPSATGATGGLYTLTAKLNKTGQVEIYAVKGYGANNNIVNLLDASGRTGNISTTPPLATNLVSAGANYMFKGLAFSPVSTTFTKPAITSISTNHAIIGATVTITGSNFSEITDVSFGGIPASFTVVSPTSITAVVGPGATGDVTVSNPAGTATLSGFTYDAPTLTAFTPAAGGLGTTVTISGTNLTGTTAVSFGGVPATSFTVASPTSITAVVGSGASGIVSLTTPGGTVSLAGFTYLPLPTITSFTPASGALGTNVTITGTNFTGATAVKFGVTPASSFTVVSANSITAVVAAGTTGNISITAPGGTATSSSSFTYLGPTISSFTPTSAGTGTTVTITGQSLTGTTAVNFGGIAATSFTIVSPTTITAVVAAGASGIVAITNPGGSTSLAGFTYLPPLNNVNLSNLTVSAGTLTPMFNKTVFNYTLAVANTINSVTLTSMVEDATSAIKVNTVATASGAASAAIPLNVGNNTINILVTSQDGTTRTYVVMVTRAPSANANLSALTVSAGVLAPAFAPDITSYSVNAGATINTTVTPVSTDNTATIKVNGTSVANGSASGVINLNPGYNTVTIAVTAQDGTTTKIYTINVINSNLQPGDDLFVHQAVSANGDGKNDIFLIEGIEKYANHVIIFTRNGVKVYDETNYNNVTKSFNGYSNINGALLQPGTYYYLIQYSLKGENRRKTGYLVLKN